jgi:hypothetical protein
MTTEPIQRETIQFSDSNEAVVVFAEKNADPGKIVEALTLREHNSVIIIVGGSAEVEPQLKSRLIQLFDRGIGRAAEQAKAIILDNGTQGGVISMIGEGIAGRGSQCSLIGVAPAAEVTYPGSKSTTGNALEPNHSHFVLLASNTWNAKKEMMFNLVKTLCFKPVTQVIDGGVLASKFRLVPVIVVVAGGDLTAKHDVLFSVRQKLPIIVFEGSGGMADEIAEAFKNKATPIEDPLLAEIIEDGELHFHSLTNSVKGIERLIIRELGVDNVLLQAWESFADYDHNANLQQRRFDRLQLSIIALGVFGTALAIIQQVYSTRTTTGVLDFPWNLVKHVLIIIPVLLTILITAANRFKQGTKWLLLRAGAESIKREIYRYRTRAMYYKDNAEQQLAKKVEDITLRTMRTEVNLSALKPYDKDKGFPPYMYASQGGDDGFTCLTPDRYVEVRLGDQLNYFKRTSVKLEKQLKALYWLTFLIGGVGTYLAAIDLQIWIALTTSIVAAFGTYLGYRQTENTLTKCNQAATDLCNVRSWWNALSAEQQAQQINIDSLVEHTEQVLQSELDGWIQQMQNALAELRKGQETQPEKEENKERSEMNVPAAASKPPTINEAGVENDETVPTNGEVSADMTETPPASETPEHISEPGIDVDTTVVSAEEDGPETETPELVVEEIGMDEPFSSTPVDEEKQLP